MEWYFWLLLGIYVWVYVSIMINVKWNKPIGGLVWALLFVVFSPFIVIASIFTTLEYYDRKRELKYAVYGWFDIGELTEEQKTTLRQLKVNEGQFDKLGFQFEGFCVKYWDIYITYGGRVVYRKEMEHKDSLFIYKWLKQHEKQDWKEVKNENS